MSVKARTLRTGFATVHQLPLNPALSASPASAGGVRSQPMKIISAAIEIGAPPMTVWAVITDLGRYPEWNPLFREASGEVAVGETITLRSVHPVNGRMMTVNPRSSSPSQASNCGRPPASPGSSAVSTSSR